MTNEPLPSPHTVTADWPARTAVAGRSANIHVTYTTLNARPSANSFTQWRTRMSRVSWNFGGGSHQAAPTGTRSSRTPISPPATSSIPTWFAKWGMVTGASVAAGLPPVSP